MPQLVTYHTTHPQIGVITLNDPSNLNAMSLQMAQEFNSLIQSFKQEKQAKPRVLILTGAGRAFSAGGDLEMLKAKIEIQPEKNRELMLEFYNSFLEILDLELPIIAAINGHAVGAGLCLAAACDVRLASNEAKLGFTFAKLGLYPGMGATYFLPRIVGQTRATELFLTAKLISAEKALEFGLISEIFKAPELLKASEKMAGEILNSGPLAVKQLLKTLRADSQQLKYALEREALFQSQNYASAEFKEGVQAALEKRTAVFR